MKQSNPAIIPKMWDTFSLQYTQHQKNPSQFCFTLINLLRVENADSILDAGCGGGHLHQYIIEKKRPNAKFVAFDFSQQMVKISAARMLKYLERKQIGSIDNLSSDEIENVNINSELFKQIQYEIFQADIMNLTQLQDNSFDIYLSNLVIFLVPDSIKALQEAYRILKPGGKIGFSVWADKAKSTALTIYQEALIKSGITQPQQGSKFLNNNDSIIDMVKQQGFIDILCWEQCCPFDNFSESDMTVFANPEVTKLLNQATEDQIKLFNQYVHETYQKSRDTMQPLTLDCYLVVAKKPL